RDAVFAANQEPHGGQPLLKWNRRIFKHSADLEREFLLQMVAIAAIQTGLFQIGNFLRVALRTAHLAIRPADRDHEFAAIVVIAEMLNCLLKSLNVFHGFFLLSKYCFNLMRIVSPNQKMTATKRIVRSVPPFMKAE